MGVTKKPTVSWLKRGAWTFCRFKGGLGKKERGVLLKGEGVDTPMRTMLTKILSFIYLQF